MEIKRVKLEIYTPKESIDNLLSVLTEIGACRVGNYSYVSSYSEVFGTWLPESASHPYNGEIGKLCRGSEYKLEVICEYALLNEAVEAVRKAHPYEEPVINIVPLIDLP